jgi:hypothetical protein
VYSPAEWHVRDICAAISGALLSLIKTWALPVLRVPATPRKSAPRTVALRRDLDHGDAGPALNETLLELVTTLAGIVAVIIGVLTVVSLVT